MAYGLKASSCDPLIITWWEETTDRPKTAVKYLIHFKEAKLRNIKKKNKGGGKYWMTRIQ